MRRLHRIWIAVVALAWLAAPVLAQVQPGSPQESFQPARPEDFGGERLPATPFVFVAYAVVWVAVFGYVFLMWRRLNRVERELADVHARLSSRGR
ncbi:MAG: CcmD family protein [Vicinamibacterales bacterium]